MNALFYLHKRILINGFKRSIRKPAFVLMLIAAIAYFVLLAAGYKSFFNNWMRCSKMLNIVCRSSPNNEISQVD